jgi:hypothetical protein
MLNYFPIISGMDFSKAIETGTKITWRIMKQMKSDSKIIIILSVGRNKFIFYRILKILSLRILLENFFIKGKF